MQEREGYFTPFSITLPCGRLLEFHRPQVMGILNVTPDSFYAGSRSASEDAVRRRVQTIVDEGADIIDIGAYSSRPGADDVSPDEEMRRLDMGLRILRQIAPTIPVSVDTFRADVARRAITESGADIINDISGGKLDEKMWSTVADLRAPYILMHMRGTPRDMMHRTDYSNVTADVVRELGESLQQLASDGVANVIIDPGFGFSKTVEQNYRMLHDLTMFHLLERPLLVGVSRKSMITRPLGITPEDALAGTVALGTMALERGAAILRVHDVAAARQSILLAGFVADPQTAIV